MKIAMCQVLKIPTFLKEFSNKEFSIQTAYKFFKIQQKTEETIKFYDENLQKIIYNYAMYDEKGQIRRNSENGILISKDKIEECTAKIQELNEYLVDFPDIYFELEEFKDVKINLEALDIISPFLKE